MTKHLLTLLLLVTLLPPFSPAFADRIEIIELQNRPASELIPILRPMLEPGGAISGTGFQLIVRTSPANLQQLRTAIARLDGTAKQLLITVRKGGNKHLQESEGSVSGSYRNSSGNITIGSDAPRNNHGATITRKGGKGQLSTRIYSTDRHNRDTLSHSVRAQEGHWATITLGESVPYPTQSVIQTPYGSSVQQGVEFKDVTSGFEVLPRVKEKRVVMEVRPFYSRRSAEGGGIIDTQSASTTVSGRVGEWIEIGGIAHQEQRRDRGIAYSSRRKGQQTQRIFVKVDLLP